MHERDAFITFINEFKKVSPTITDQQRIGLLQRAVQQHGIAVDEATEILNAAGMIVGEKENFFEVLGISIEQIHELDDQTIVNTVEVAHDKHYRASLTAGARIRPDGKTEEQWRSILNQARDTLKNPQKRKQYLDTILSDNSQTEVQETELQKTSEEVPNIPTTDIKSTSNSDLTAIPPDMDVPEDLVFIPAGEFQMGTQEQVENGRKMTVQTIYTGAFFIDKYPVTNAQYKEFLDAKPEWHKNRIFQRYHDGSYLQTWSSNNYPRGKADYPVVDVSWFAAMAYAKWAGKRLPTEAEWEKAARGGLDGKKYPWGDEIDINMANYGMQIGSTTPVGDYPPNDYGMYDAAGNVWEWCLDEYDEDTLHRNIGLDAVNVNEITKNFLTIETSRVLRGGSWASSNRATQVAYFGWAAPNFTYCNYGFRCIKEISL